LVAIGLGNYQVLYRFILDGSKILALSLVNQYWGRHPNTLFIVVSTLQGQKIADRMSFRVLLSQFSCWSVFGFGNTLFLSCFCFDSNQFHFTHSSSLSQ